MLVKTQPTHIPLIMGPLSCGKTALAQHIRQQLQEEGAMVCYINCRAVNATSSSGRQSQATSSP
jgi:Cdc6-like AAA superfamily ATPase